MASTTRLTRVIASSTTLTRRWRHFCTEASPSPSPPSPSPSPSPSRLTLQDMYKEGLLDLSELEQVEEFERKRNIFFQKKRSYKQMRKFFANAYDNMKRSETRYPGEVTKVLTGNFKGWRVYKPTLEAIPKSIEDIEGSPEWQRIFIENRERWYKEGMFEILFEGDVFKLRYNIEGRCLELVEAAALGIPLGKDLP